MARRRVALGLLAAVTCALASAAACSTFEGEPAAPDAGGGGDASDGSVGTDSPADGAGPDAHDRDGSTADGSARPCRDPHWLCDDFDRDGGSIAQWTPYIVGDASLGTRPALGAPSFPRALEAIVPDNAVAAMHKSSVGSSNGLVCEFSMRIQQRDTTGPVYFLDIILPSANAANRFGLQLAAGPANGLTAQIASTPDGGSLVVESGSVDVPADTWFKVSVEIRPTLPRVIARVNGTVFMDRTTTLPKASPVQAQNFQLGPGTGPSASPWIVLFDDVVCDLVP